MTKKDALTIALSTLTASTYTNPSYDGKETTRKEIPATEVAEVLQKMLDQLSKPHTTSPEAKSKANADTYAEAFNVLMSVAGSEPHTVKELFAMTDAWPEGFTPSKLQYAITRMWTDTFEKIENAKSANQYKLR